MLTDLFREKSNADNALLRERDNDELLAGGNLSSGRILKPGALSEHQRKMAAQGAQNAKKDDTLLYIMLNQVDAQIAMWEMDLQSRYGEDYAQGMIDKLLTEAEREDITYEEQLQLLFNKYLDEDGNPIDNSQEAKDVAKLRDIERGKELALDINRNGLNDQNMRLSQAIFNGKDTDKIAGLGQAAQEIAVKQDANQALKQNILGDSEVTAGTNSAAFSIPSPPSV